MSSGPETISVGEAISVPPTFCANCQSPETGESKLLRCARCKLSRYCNRSCQRQHFSLHKKGCKAICRLQGQLDEQESNGAESSAANTCILLGDIFVELTYRFSRTPQSALDGFASAVRYYIRAVQYDHTARSQVTKISFLLTAMGQDEAAVSFIYYNASNEDSNKTMIGTGSIIPRISPYDDFLALPGASTLTSTDLVTLLFIKMKLVATDCDTATTSTEEDQDVAGSSPLTTQMNELRNAINPHILDAIQHCIPLSPTDTPTLFDSETPFEYWCLLQDYFFLTPGVTALLDDSSSDNER